MASTTGPIFAHLMRNEDIRSRILSNLDNSTKSALRLTSLECCEHVTKPLFMRTRLTFAPSSLTRPARKSSSSCPHHNADFLQGLEALSRIGQHIESLTFYFPHSEETFLPPLLNPETGREINFLYNPHTTAQVLQHRPKYGSPELGDLLTQQYPPCMSTRSILSEHKLIEFSIPCRYQCPGIHQSIQSPYLTQTSHDIMSWSRSNTALSSRHSRLRTYLIEDSS